MLDGKLSVLCARIGTMTRTSLLAKRIRKGFANYKSTTVPVRMVSRFHTNHDG